MRKVVGTNRRSLRLNDNFIDFEKPIVVKKDGQAIYRGQVERRLRTLLETFSERADVRLSFSAEIALTW